MCAGKVEEQGGREEVAMLKAFYVYLLTLLVFFVIDIFLDWGRG